MPVVGHVIGQQNGLHTGLEAGRKIYVDPVGINLWKTIMVKPTASLIQKAVYGGTGIAAEWRKSLKLKSGKP